MSEQQLKDFAEVAELRVPVPDVDGIVSRGRDLRRLRRVAAAGALAIAVVTGGVLSSVTRNDRSDPPVVDPTPPGVAAQELATRSLSDAALVEGREYVVFPWQLSSTDDVEARFRVPGPHWVWREDGAIRPLTPGKVFPNTPREPYARVGVATPDRVPATGCELEVPEWTPLEMTPIAAARQIARIPSVVVEQRARATRVLGHTAAHVRMSVPRLCPEYGDVIVWGQASAIGSGTVDYPGQVMDVWVVDVDGILVVVHTEVSPGLPESVVDETRALFGSLTLDRVSR
jgi:hypothetical protein